MLMLQMCDRYVTVFIEMLFLNDTEWHFFDLEIKILLDKIGYR